LQVRFTTRSQVQTVHEVKQSTYKAPVNNINQDRTSMNYIGIAVDGVCRIERKDSLDVGSQH